MVTEFLYDIFFCHNEADVDNVRKICDQFRHFGLRPFFAPDDLSDYVGREGWEDRIAEAIGNSQNLGVYCSTDASLSDWVKREIAIFDGCRQTGARDDRKILAIPDPDLSPDRLQRVVAANSVLGSVLRPRDSLHALEIVAERRIRQLSAELHDASEKLDQTKDLSRQAFEYYRHTRFWRPFARTSGQDLHIFTCGRDTHEDTTQRGAGGRTSIDKWDYQAAVDITHYFARHHREIGVVIEQPVSKARIDEATRWFDTSEFSQRLINRNCVIIGSPDVSDFAEITLAKLLRVQPYIPDIALNTGFRILKDGRRFSTFYDQALSSGSDGVRLIRDGEPAEFWASTNDRDHGVMILADNPFSEPAREHKILILAGHSGVATRAMSLLLTHEEPWCLDAFYGLDQEIAVMGDPLAAVIEVNFTRMPGHEKFGDDRDIPSRPGAIAVRGVIPLRA